jgi:capsular polysaccharide biosynthesis protein
LSEAIPKHEGASARATPHEMSTPTQRGPIAFYEGQAFETLRTLWRKKLLLGSFMIAGLTLAVVALNAVENTYSANALIQFDFGKSDEEKAAPPTATMDAAILVEGEAQIIRSASLARRVVSRLKLDENPDYTSGGALGRLLSLGGSPGAGLALSNVDRAVRRLSRQITVTNNGRTYLITITAESTSPEWSATLANAFLREYVDETVLRRLRESEAAARTALAEARATYGDLHPNVIQAKAALAAAEERTRQQESTSSESDGQLPRVRGQSFVQAESEWLPSGPNPIAYLAIGLLGSLLAGAALVLLQERRDTGFRTEVGVPLETGVRCVGMIPRASDRLSPNRKVERREAIRSLCLTTGLIARNPAEGPAGQARASRVVMTCSPLAVSGKSDFVDELSRSLVDEGCRVLVIDTSPSSDTGSEIGLADVLDSAELLQQFFNDERDNPTSTLRRKAGPNGARNPFASFAYAGRAFDRLLAEAKTHYDIILIDTPPVLLFADSMFLGHFVDVSLLVASWNKSPRSTVTEAVHRLRDNAVRVDGIVLTEVDLGRYPSFARGDRTYYLSKHRDAFERPALQR